MMEHPGAVEDFCEREARPVILHYHLFKNAGTSVDALLKDRFPGQWATAEFPEQPQTNRARLANWIQANTNIACFSSHTAMLPPPDLPGILLTPIIFLRHPLDRIASAYSFESKQRDDGFGATLARNTSMRGYIEVRLSLPEDRQCRNFQTDRLSRFLHDHEGSERDRALHAVEELPFIGIVEEFDESIRFLEDLLRSRGFPSIALSAVRHNVSRGRANSLGARLEKMAENIGEDHFEELLRINADDLAVYHAAVMRLQAKAQLAQRP